MDLLAESHSRSSPSVSVSYLQDQNALYIHDMPSPASGSFASGTAYSPSHPLAVPKFICSICGDRATGRHYGIISCEGCKGFFKRTIRNGKEDTYVCRHARACIVDRLHRNRCQYCRYYKCLQMGMRKDGVQSDLLASTRKRGRRAKLSNPEGRATVAVPALAAAANNPPEAFSILDVDLEPTTSSFGLSGISTTTPEPFSPMLEASIHEETIDSTDQLDFSIPQLVNADAVLLGAVHQQVAPQMFPVNSKSSTFGLPGSTQWIMDLCEKEINLALIYARSCPVFRSLTVGDQLALMKCAWNELHLSAMAGRTLLAGMSSGLLLSSGVFVEAAPTELLGLHGLVERMSIELVSKMASMKVDSIEMACLRGIVLFNPDAKGLADVQCVETCREKLFAGLEKHCAQIHPDDKSRFGKILLRLPSLRSTSLKCPDVLFFSQLLPHTPVDAVLLHLLGQPNADVRSVIGELYGEIQVDM